MGFRTGNTSAGAGSTSEPLVWTVNEGAAIQSQCNDSTMQKALGKSDQVLEDALEYAMRRSQIKVIYPDQTEFVSAMPESHRKSEKAYHVKAFRGSKDGRHVEHSFPVCADSSQDTCFSSLLAYFSASRNLYSSSH